MRGLGQDIHYFKSLESSFDCCDFWLETQHARIQDVLHSCKLDKWSTQSECTKNVGGWPPLRLMSSCWTTQVIAHTTYMIHLCSFSEAQALFSVLCSDWILNQNRALSCHCSKMLFTSIWQLHHLRLISENTQALLPNKFYQVFICSCILLPR